MTEEKKEEKKEEAKAEEKKQAAPKAEEKPKKVEKPAEAAAPGAETAKEKKGKKISRMTLAEVEHEIKAVQEKMGAFQSTFAQHLLARKKELTEEVKTQK